MKCPIETNMAIRLAAGGPKEQVKNDKAGEETVSPIKLKADKYELAEVPKRPRAQICTDAVDSNEVPPKTKNIV